MSGCRRFRALSALPVRTGTVVGSRPEPRQRCRGGSRVVLISLLLLSVWVGGVFADGLPGEYLLSNQWRNLFAYYSPLDNPAFMTQQNYTSLRGVVCIAPDEVAQLWETGVVVPIGLYQSVGLSWIAENGHEIGDGSFVGGEYVASDETERNHNSLFLGSCAINPWRGLSVGGNAAVFHQSGFGDPSQSIGVDAGAAYRLLRHPLPGFHLMGVTAQNLFTQKTSDLLERNNAAQLKMTSHSSWLENRVTLDCQVDITDILAASSNFAEDAASTEWDLTGQAGVWILRLFQINACFGLGDDNLEFWGLAVGMNAPSVNAGRGFSVIYQFRDERSSDLKRNRYFNDRITYNTVVEALAMLRTKGESETKHAMSDSPHQRQKEVRNAIDEYLVFSDEHDRRSFFGRNADALKADIEYVLATAQRRKQEAATGGVVDKQLRKSREIDEEIEELKQELEELPEK